MPTVNLTKRDGKLCGLAERDAAAYAKWRGRIGELSEGASLIFSWKEPRSGAFHGRHFAIIAALFGAQEQFDDPEMFRKWLEVGAGYCKFVPSSRGKMIALPQSISYDSLDQAEFEQIHAAIMAFARSLPATRFLWPHLPDEQGGEMVATVLREFE